MRRAKPRACPFFGDCFDIPDSWTLVDVPGFPARHDQEYARVSSNMRAQELPLLRYGESNRCRKSPSSPAKSLWAAALFAFMAPKTNLARRHSTMLAHRPNRRDAVPRAR